MTSPEFPVDDRAWREAGHALLVRALAELSYEDLLVPEPLGERQYRIALGGDIEYTFAADRSAFDSWRIDADSVRRNGARAGDPMEFLVDARSALGLDGATTAEALRELVATWSADALLLRNLPTAAELADAAYADLESAQGGHPAMVLNKGRLGFTASDAEAYAPEAGRTLRLTWIAVHPSLASAHGAPVDDLDATTTAAFAAKAPEGYVWLPVHPFHLDACVRTLFAPYLADGRIVVLGEAPDRYRALASVRTLVNVDHPEKRNVKVPLLIRNTLVWRGLPAEPTAGAPAVSAWLHTVRAADPFLASSVDLLGEVASVAVRHPLFDRVPDAPYRYHELLAAVWREPVQTYLRAGEKARSLASLLVTGSDGRALIAELVTRSGLSARDWLRTLVDVVLAGPLHALHAHDLAFCPHGENTVVVFSAGDVPVRTMLKDFAEDVNLLPGRAYPGLPPEADRLLPRWSERELAHSIVTAVFAGVFRPLAVLAEGQLGVSDFWALVRASVDGYFARHPELEERRLAYGLTADEVERICLNREQLTGGGFHDRAEKEEFEIVHGTVPNPLVREAGR